MAQAELTRGAVELLRQRLEELEWRLRTLTLLRGAGWVAGVFVVCVGVSLTLDFLFALPSAVRTALLAATVVGLLSVAWRKLFRPLGQAVRPEELAAVAERAFPQFNERLVSSVELGDEDVPEQWKGSALMRELLLRQTLKQTARVDLTRSLPAGPYLRSFLVGTLSLVLLLVPALLVPDGYALLWKRLFMPWQSTASAGFWTFDVEPGNCVVVRGDDVTIAVTIRRRTRLGQLPEVAWLETVSESGARDRRRLVLAPEGPIDTPRGSTAGRGRGTGASSRSERTSGSRSSGSSSAGHSGSRLRSRSVPHRPSGSSVAGRPVPAPEQSVRFQTTVARPAESFEYTVWAGREHSETYRVQVVERPEVTAATLDVQPPAYTGLPAQFVDGVLGDIPVFEHSELTFRVWFNKPVREAFIEWQRPKPEASGQRADGEADANAAPTDTRSNELPTQPVDAEQAQAVRPGSDEPASATPEADQAAGDQTPPGSRREKGSPPEQSDQPSEPAFSVVRQPMEVAPDGRSAVLRCRADLGGPFAFVVKDVYGFENQNEPYRCLRVVRDQPPQLALPDQPERREVTASQKLPIPVVATDDIAVGELELHVQRADEPPRVTSVPADRLGQERVEYTFTLDLAALDLKVGDVVTYRVRAADTRAVPGPQETWSTAHTLVVAPEAPPPGFERLTAEQRRLKEELESILAELAEQRQSVEQTARQAATAQRSPDRFDNDQIPQQADRNRQLQRLVEQLADRFQQHPLYANLATATREAAQPLAEAERQLKQAFQAPLRQKRRPLTSAAGQLRRAEQQLQDVARRFDELAELERDLFELNQLADQTRQLASDVLQLQQKQAEMLADGQTPEQVRTDTADAARDLLQRQQDLTQELTQLLDRRPELLDAARQDMLQQLSELSRRALELAEPQELLSKALTEQAQQQAEQAQPLVQQQAKAWQQARDLAADVEAQRGTAPVPAVDPQTLREALEALRRGDLPQAAEASRSAAEALREVADELRKAADLPDNPKAAVEELARRQRALADQLRRATPAADTSQSSDANRTSADANPPSSNAERPKANTDQPNAKDDRPNPDAGPLGADVGQPNADRRQLDERQLRRQAARQVGLQMALANLPLPPQVRRDQAQAVRQAADTVQALVRRQPEQAARQASEAAQTLEQLARQLSEQSPTPRPARSERPDTGADSGQSSTDAGSSNPEATERAGAKPAESQQPTARNDQRETSERPEAGRPQTESGQAANRETTGTTQTDTTQKAGAAQQGATGQAEGTTRETEARQQAEAAAEARAARSREDAASGQAGQQTRGQASPAEQADRAEADRRQWDQTRQRRREAEHAAERTLRDAASSASRLAQQQSRLRRDTLRAARRNAPSRAAQGLREQQGRLADALERLPVQAAPLARADAVRHAREAEQALQQGRLDEAAAHQQQVVESLREVERQAREAAEAHRRAARAAERARDANDLQREQAARAAARAELAERAEQLAQLQEQLARQAAEQAQRLTGRTEERPSSERSGTPSSPSREEAAASERATEQPPTTAQAGTPQAAPQQAESSQSERPTEPASQPPEEAAPGRQQPSRDASAETATAQPAATEPATAESRGTEEPAAERASAESGAGEPASGEQQAEAASAEAAQQVSASTDQTARVAELLTRQAELNRQAARFALDAAARTGQQSEATQHALQAVQHGTETSRQAQAGRFRQAAQAARQAADALRQATTTLPPTSDTATLRQRGLQLEQQQREVAQTLSQLADSTATARQTQHELQQQLAEAAEGLSEELAETAQTLAAQPLSMQQEAERAQRAEQAVRRGEQSMTQAARALEQGNVGQAAEAAQQAVQALREAAQLAGQPQATGAATPLPPRVGSEVAQAAQQLQQAGQQLARASGQPATQQAAATTDQARDGQRSTTGEPGEAESRSAASSQAAEAGDASAHPGDASQQANAGQSGRPGPTKQSASASLEQSLARAAEALNRAAQSLRGAAQRLQPSRNRRRNGSPTQAPPTSNAAAGTPSSTGDGSGARVGVDLSQLQVQLKQLTNRNWGELPGYLQTEILQAAQKRPNGDYAKLIKLYFQEISQSHAQTGGSP